MLGGKCVWPTTISMATLEMCFINIPSTIQKHAFQFEHDKHVLGVIINLKASKYFADVVIVNRGAEMGGGGADLREGEGHKGGCSPRAPNQKRGPKNKTGASTS